MKKTFKISALALAMSALLFSCADPNNNNANGGNNGGNKPDTPAGGKDNVNDVFQSKSWNVKNTMEGVNTYPAQFVFADNGTFIEKVSMEETLTPVAEFAYTIDDKKISTTAEKKLDYESMTLKTKSETIASGTVAAKTEIEAFKKDPNKTLDEHSPLSHFLEAAGYNEAENDEAKKNQAIDKALDLWIKNIENEVTLEFSMYNIDYEYTKGSDGKYNLKSITPEVKKMPDDFYSLVYEKGLISIPNEFDSKYSLDETGDWSNGKAPLIKNEGNTKVNATWSKTGTGNDQIITITVSGTEKYEFKATPMTLELTEITE